MVVAFNTREDAAQETLQQVVADGGSGELLQLDVSAKEDTIRAAVRKIVDRKKRIDILVNNAGTTAGDALLASMPMETMEQQFRTNFWGFAQCT